MSQSTLGSRVIYVEGQKERKVPGRGGRSAESGA